MKVAQSCPTLCNPMGYTVHGILQTRILEWVAFPFSRVSSQPRDWAQVSHIVGRFFTSTSAILGTEENLKHKLSSAWASQCLLRLKNNMYQSDYEISKRMTTISPRSVLKTAESTVQKQKEIFQRAISSMFFSSLSRTILQMRKQAIPCPFLHGLKISEWLLILIWGK